MRDQCFEARVEDRDGVPKTGEAGGRGVKGERKERAMWGGKVQAAAEEDRGEGGESDRNKGGHVGG